MRIGRVWCRVQSPLLVRIISQEEMARIHVWQATVDREPERYTNVLYLDGGSETVVIENGKVISVK